VLDWLCTAAMAAGSVVIEGPDRVDKESIPVRQFRILIRAEARLTDPSCPTSRRGFRGIPAC
jgi:hypothetical protein